MVKAIKVDVMHFQNLITTNEFQAFLNKSELTSVQKSLDLLIDLKKNLEQRIRTQDFDDEYLPSREKYLIDMERLQNQLTLSLVEHKKLMPVHFADSILLSTSSVLRARHLCQLHGCLDQYDWLKMFMDYWVMVEFADEVLQPMRKIMCDMNATYIMDEFADTEAKEQWDALPDTLVVYRGCSEKSKDGFSWSLDLKTAKRFALKRFDLFNGLATKIRIFSSLVEPSEKERCWSMEKEDVYLLRGEVKKEDAILFLERNESEIFTTRVKVLDEYLIEEIDDIDWIE